MRSNLSNRRVSGLARRARPGSQGPPPHPSATEWLRCCVGAAAGGFPCRWSERRHGWNEEAQRPSAELHGIRDPRRSACSFSSLIDGREDTGARVAVILRGCLLRCVFCGDDPRAGSGVPESCLIMPPARESALDRARAFGRSNCRVGGLAAAPATRKSRRSTQLSHCRSVCVFLGRSRGPFGCKPALKPQFFDQRLNDLLTKTGKPFGRRSALCSKRELE